MRSRLPAAFVVTVSALTGVGAGGCHEKAPMHGNPPLREDALDAGPAVQMTDVADGDASTDASPRTRYPWGSSPGHNPPGHPVMPHPSQPPPTTDPTSSGGS